MPKLPEQSLVDLIQPLKQLNDSLGAAEGPVDIDIEPVLNVLWGVTEKDSLLNDFLKSSGYEGVKRTG